MSEAKSLRKSFINSSYKTGNAIQILKYVNKDLKELLKDFKGKSCNSQIIDFESVNYKFWSFVSEVYLFCKEKKRNLIDQLKEFNFSIEADEECKDNPEEIASLLANHSSYDFLITNNNTVVITGGLFDGVRQRGVFNNIHHRVQGNVYYITIRGDITGTDFPEGVSYDLSTIPRLINKITKYLNGKYTFNKIGPACCVLETVPKSNMIKIDDDGKLYILWDIFPKVQADIIYCLEEDRFHIVLMPFLVLSCDYNTDFMIYNKSEYPEIPLSCIYFEPYELDLNKLMGYNNKTVIRKIKEFENICEKIKPILMNAAVSLSDSSCVCV